MISDLGVSDIGAKSVTRVLQSQIVNALHLGERDKASNILSSLSHGNDPLRSDDFVCILDYCARSPDPLFVMETWRIMEEKEIGMNTTCYMLIIQALTKGGYLEEAFNWLSYLGGIPHSVPDLPMYNVFLSGCIRMRSIGHIDSCLELMENQMVGKSEDTYWELLKLAVLQENLYAVHEIWKEYTKYYSPDITFLRKVIKCFTVLGDLCSAYKALQHSVALVFQGNAFVQRSSKLDIPIPSTNDFEFKKCGMSTTGDDLTRENHLDTFNAKTDALCGSVKSSNSKFVEATSEGRSFPMCDKVCQDSGYHVLNRELGNGNSDQVINNLRLSFNDVIHACAQDRKCVLDEQLFLQMQRLGIKPSSNTYDGLIRAAVRKRGLRNALKMLKEMEEANFKPSTSTLAILSIGCSNVLELDLAEALLDQIHTTSWLWPFNALLIGYDKTDQPERAVRLLAKMKQLNLKFDTKTYELLFSLFGCVNAPYEDGNILSRAEAAKRINAIELDMRKNGILHSHSSMEKLLKALGAEGMIKELMQHFHMAENQLILTNNFKGTIIYNTVLHSLVEANENLLATDIFKDMKSRGVPADMSTYNIMIDCCYSSGCYKSACMFVSMMIRDGFFPHLSTYTSLIQASFSTLVANDGFDEALHLLNQMNLERIQSDVQLFNSILFQAYMKDRIDIVELIVKQMHQERIKPDPDTCSFVFHAYKCLGLHIAAMEALQVLSMRMISYEESVLQKKKKYFEENFIFVEDQVEYFVEYRGMRKLRYSSEVELHILKESFKIGDYEAAALWNLRMCAVNGFSLSWSPDQSEWAKQLSCSHSSKNELYLPMDKTIIKKMKKRKHIAWVLRAS
ncbi:hypothetical protein AQUCO_01500044v1 [Aquilegia coerulea]|uniref:Pentacotripeptide-repeat region of PRORP domain-containing protein n=1 Tax=Aquilegia coerulea TaxID=218851 RepID=A0A2G5DRW2_AQUCA|nr:hypothetical protein AQUCO_01500044v1 [Aquilegia coerulea]